MARAGGREGDTNGSVTGCRARLISSDGGGGPADTSHAGWGEVRRVPVPGVVPSETELGQWPARGEVYECRRSTLGGYAWQPLFPPIRPGRP